MKKCLTQNSTTFNTNIPRLFCFISSSPCLDWSEMIVWAGWHGRVIDRSWSEEMVQSVHLDGTKIKIYWQKAVFKFNTLAYNEGVDGVRRTVDARLPAVCWLLVTPTDSQPSGTPSNLKPGDIKYLLCVAVFKANISVCRHPMMNYHKVLACSMILGYHIRV